MGENELSRRSFLCMTLLGCLSLGGVSLLASCQKGPEMEGQGAAEMAKGGDPCDDVSGLTDQEMQTRVANSYVGKSTIKGEYCSNCRFFITGEPCGTCEIVKGPIDPAGYCTAWTVRET